MKERELNFASMRERMVRHDLISRNIADPKVLDVFRRVPRERFVWDADLEEAYDDHPLRIGEGQTISQPYIVALMTQLLDVQPCDRVLEIGTGSGYQTAVLASLAGTVYTVERFSALSERARETLGGLGIANVEYTVGDGTRGWEEEAPFHKIMVTAAAPDVPQSLKRQLADGGRLVIPVGTRSQSLLVCDKEGDTFKEHRDCGVIFVKLIGEEGF